MPHNKSLISLLVTITSLILSVLAPYFLYQLFSDRVEANAIQELTLERELNESAIANEIEQRKAIIEILDSYFQNSTKVSDAEFARFLERLPDFSNLSAICWLSVDSEVSYRYGSGDLCDYFSFAEQNKVIPDKSLLMLSEYIETDGEQLGFVTIFISFDDLLASFEEDDKYTSQFLLYNNSTQEFVRVTYQGIVDSSNASRAFDLTESESITQIGDVELFYVMNRKNNFMTKISTTETIVCGMTFLTIIVGGLFLAYLISVRQKIEEQVEEQTASLKIANKQAHRMRQRAEELAEHKQRFLANMSHEIRTPMNGVLGVAQLLEDEQLTSKQHDYVRVISESGNQMVGILNDILDQSKIDAGMIELQNDVVDLRELLQELCKVYNSSAVVKGLNISLEIATSVPKLVKLDTMRFKQIISNLISNSLKFTEQGGITVTAETLGESIRFSVIDSGIGIPEDIIDSLFLEFSQADKSTTRNYGGTGLGLSISQKLLKLMSSKLRVQSTVGKGSMFYFDLVVSTLTEDEQHELKAVELDESATLVWPEDKTVLVVEDNMINMMLIKAHLEKFGINAVQVVNGKEAVDYLREQPVDVILMDCQMPILDGYEATKLIRKMTGPQPYIIALTANVLPEDREACFAVGMNEYIPKPIDKSILKEKLQVCLQEIS